MPNITLGPMIVAAARKATSLPLDVHLMIEHPELHLEAFADAGADIITVHAEACVHLHRDPPVHPSAGRQGRGILQPGNSPCAVSRTSPISWISSW